MSQERKLEIQQLVASSAGVYGAVDKQSIVPPELWSRSAQYQKARQNRVVDWITKHDIEEKPITEPVVPIGCALYVNHRYRYIYVRQFKSGSTAFMHYFGNCAGYRGERGTCLTRIPMDAPLEEVQQQLRDYTVFTLVRNPYTRAASGFSYLNDVVRAEFASPAALEDPRCHVDWSTFCQNPRVLARHCREAPHCCGDEAAQRAMNLNVLMQHTDPQALCALGADGTWAVDYIVRSEKSDEDIGALVNLINERRPAGVDRIDGARLEQANAQRCEPSQGAWTGSDSRGQEPRQGQDGEGSPCNPVDKYLKQYLQHEECFVGISNYYKEDVKFLKYGQLT